MKNMLLIFGLLVATAQLNAMNAGDGKDAHQSDAKLVISKEDKILMSQMDNIDNAVAAFDDKKNSEKSTQFIDALYQELTTAVHFKRRKIVNYIFMACFKKDTFFKKEAIEALQNSTNDEDLKTLLTKVQTMDFDDIRSFLADMKKKREQLKRKKEFDRAIAGSLQENGFI